eukprot:EG_transcript_9197
MPSHYYAISEAESSSVQKSSWRTAVLAVGACAVSAVALDTFLPTSLFASTTSRVQTAQPLVASLPKASHAELITRHLVPNAVPVFQSTSHNDKYQALGLTAFASGVLMMLTAASLIWRHFTANDAIAMASTTGAAGVDPADQGTDARAERHRVEQRVVFNAERWRKHRGLSRFSRALFTISKSYVIGHVVKPVIAISISTAALCAAQLYIGTDVFNLPTSLFSLSAPSLGLLLVFRTNASYERWDGARKMIGLVKNRSEDLVRQVCVRFPDDRYDLKEQMVRYIQAFFFSLKVHLRSGPGGFEDDSNLIEDLTPILKPREMELLLKSTNRPAHIMNCMTQIVKEAKLEGGALMCLDQNLTTLADVLGGCERILRTPIPLSYTRMTTRFLFVWLLLLPLALSGEIMRLDHNIWLTVPAVAFIAFGLLGVEEVGVQIEEPFSILPMEAYAAGSKNNTGGIFAQMNGVAEVTKLNK